jgi:hypothetical protein
MHERNKGETNGKGKRLNPEGYAKDFENQTNVC